MAFRQRHVPDQHSKGGMMRLAKTKEQLRRLLDLRRSNAASSVQSKKKYSRKQKHKDKGHAHED